MYAIKCGLTRFYLSAIHWETHPSHYGQETTTGNHAQCGARLFVTELCDTLASLTANEESSFNVFLFYYFIFYFCMCDWSILP